MIGADVRFEGFDARSWTHLLSLFAPGIQTRIARAPARSDAPEVTKDEVEGHSAGTLLIVHDTEGTVLKAHHTVQGRVRDVDYGGPGDMDRLARQYRAHRCLVVQEGALEELAERVAIRLQRGEDYLSQWLTVLRVLRELEEAELIRMWPQPSFPVPIPRPPTVRRAFDAVMPDGQAVVAMLWDRGAPWTAIALRRQQGLIDRIAGPELIHRWTGPMGGDWRRDHRVVTEAVSRELAPVHLGVFSEARTMQQLLRSPDAGTWARAAAVRDVIFQPAPPYVAIALSADALRAFAASSARWIGGMDVLSSMTGPVGNYLRGRISEVVSVTSTLGFNPLRALAEALRRTDEEPPPPLPQGGDQKTEKNG